MHLKKLTKNNHGSISTNFGTTVEKSAINSTCGFVNKKAQLMQRGRRDSGAYLKAHCEHKLSSPIPATDIGRVHSKLKVQNSRTFKDRKLQF